MGNNNKQRMSEIYAWKKDKSMDSLIMLEKCSVGCSYLNDLLRFF